jgi:hypothetical protein
VISIKKAAPSGCCLFALADSTPSEFAQICD